MNFKQITILYAAIVLIVFIACNKREEPMPNDSYPATRAFSHEDNIKRGLLLDTAWADPININF